MTNTAIIHVHISDDLTGRLLADVDASSVPDGLAYYLRSRHLDDHATAKTVLNDCDSKPGTYAPVDDYVGILREQRDFAGNLESAVYAHVEGQCPELADCHL